jgi:hypothetical protein
MNTMPTYETTLDPTKAKIARPKRSDENPTFAVGTTYLMIHRFPHDSKKTVRRELVTVIGRKTTGRTTTITAILVSEKGGVARIARGLRVTDNGYQGEGCILYGSGGLAWEQSWLWAKNRVTNL